MIRPIQINSNQKNEPRETLSQLMKKHRSEVLKCAAKSKVDIGMQFNMGRFKEK